jgi:sugar phosphate isomerase/epimerase
VRLACSTAAFPQDRLDIAVAKVAWAGYDGVEVALHGDELPEEEALRARLRAEELELTSVFAGSLLPEAGADGLVTLGRAAALTRALDGGLCVLTAPAEGDLAAVTAALRLLDRALGPLPVPLCLVNRRATLLEGPEALHALWREGLPERVGLALDPGQAHLCGWDPRGLGALPELPRHVYLSDARGDRAVPPGEGEVDLEGLADGLRLRGYGGSVCVLLENADPWAVEPLAQEARELAAAWFR